MLERVKFFGFDMDYTLAGKIDKHMSLSRVCVCVGGGGGGGGGQGVQTPPPP